MEKYLKRRITGILLAGIMGVALFQINPVSVKACQTPKVQQVGVYQYTSGMVENVLDENINNENLLNQSNQLALYASNEQNVDLWTNYASTKFASGKGTKNDPYLISSAAELSLMAKNVNAELSGYNKAWCDVHQILVTTMAILG